MTFFSWPEIESFHHIRRAVVKYPELLGGTNTVRYRGKVKLHGTNAAVVIRSGRVTAQSRTATITTGNDNAGFAGWVEAAADLFVRAAIENGTEDVIIYGEWCGPGIQRGVAACQIPSKSFAVFAACRIDDHGNIVDDMHVQPDELEHMIKDVTGAYVIPWYGNAIDVPWLDAPETLEPIVHSISEDVGRVEAEDPWVAEVFGIKGTGEGIVYYPVSHHGLKHFSNIAFKAKGHKHKVIETAKPAQVDPEIASSATAFATMVLTESRLEQGARAVNGGEFSCEHRLIGPFIAWVTGDVKKECEAELVSSNLNWKQVQKPLVDRAREWYVQLSNTT